MHVCVCVYMWVCVPECGCPRRSEASEYLELELQMIVEQPDMRAGNQLRFFERAASSFNHYYIISPDPLLQSQNSSSIFVQ